MANNAEFFCNHCGHHTAFYLQSDLIWYCDICGHPLNSYPELDDTDIEEELSEFESEYGKAVYCRTCGNFIVLKDIDEAEICPYCADDISMELERKHVHFDTKQGKFVKDYED